MTRLVANCFKAIMFSMLFILVFDLGFYLYRAFSLNARMESVMTSMQKVIIENNYLPEGDYELYKSIFTRVADDMNQGDVFINGFSINYDHDPVNAIDDLDALKYKTNGQAVNENILRTRMDTPADYGDVMVVQVRVNVNQPMWGWGGTQETYDYSGEASPEWGKLAPRTTTFAYTYYVPCLKYIMVTE